MLKSKLFNSRGITLIQIMFVITVMVALMVALVPNILDINKDKKVAEVNSNVSQIESAVKSYLFANNTLPTKDAISIGDFPFGTPMKKFYTSVLDEGSLTGTEINSRFKLPDVKKLVAENYLSGGIEEQDQYVVDKVTTKVLYVGDIDNQDINAFVGDIIKSGGDVFNLTYNGEAKLEDGGKRINEVLTTVAIDNKLVVGGKGTMTLALLDMSENDGGFMFNKVTDLTGKLVGSGAKTVTEIRYLGNNQILAHYHDGTKLSYATIKID